ncbi:hypothetical protein ACJZ2D_014825 [Fusarium nematophilum]
MASPTTGERASIHIYRSRLTSDSEKVPKRSVAESEDLAISEACGSTVETASAPYGSGNLIQGLIILNNPDYAPERWHGTLIYIFVLVIAFILNIWGSRILPMLENLIMVLHILFFFAMLLAVAIIPPSRHSSEFVFTFFQNNSGWESDGIAWCLGLLTSAYVMVGMNTLFKGYDSATHMSEEMQNPRMGVPRAMIGSLVLNGTMGFALLIAILFGMGDLKTALDAPTRFPIIEIFSYMTRNNLAATSAMVCTIIISASLATVGLLASTSRTLWAYARDGAPPFCLWLSKLDRKRHIPSNAVISSTAFLVLLGLLNIASTTAFNAILSLTVVTLCLSYLLPIVAMLYRRTRTPEKLSFGPWCLPPKIGIMVNIVAVCFNVFICVFLLLPPFQPVTATNMNYAGVVLGSVLILISIDWLFRGRKVYTGPRTSL